jgi:hypothetical protein
LFEEPGKLERVAQLASEWFLCFLSRHRPRGEGATAASIKEEGEKRRD